MSRIGKGMANQTPHGIDTWPRSTRQPCQRPDGKIQRPFFPAARVAIWFLLWFSGAWACAAGFEPRALTPQGVITSTTLTSARINVGVVAPSFFSCKEFRPSRDGTFNSRRSLRETLQHVPMPKGVPVAPGLKKVRSDPTNTAQTMEEYAMTPAPDKASTALNQGSRRGKNARDPTSLIHCIVAVPACMSLDCSGMRTGSSAATHAAAGALECRELLGVLGPSNG